MNAEKTKTPPCPLCSSAATAPYLAPTARCRDCGFVFGLPYCSQFSEKCGACPNKCANGDTAAPSYYGPRTAAMRLKVEAARLRRIESLAGPLSGKKVTETGAGAGALASLMLGAGAAYTGYEPTPLLYKECLREFPAAAGHIANFMPDAGTLKLVPCDLAVAIDVLEYIAGPAAFLAGLAAALAPGGALYLEVPDESSFALRTRARKALRLYNGPVHPGHINFFSMRTLLAAAAAARLKPLAAGRLSLLADKPRLEATFRRPLPLWLKAASLAARLTKADLALGQGNLYALLRREGTAAP